MQWASLPVGRQMLENENPLIQSIGDGSAVTNVLAACLAELHARTHTTYPFVAGGGKCSCCTAALMDVFVVVSIATVYQKNGTATEARVRMTDPLRCLLLFFSVVLCLYKHSVENHRL